MAKVTIIIISYNSFEDTTKPCLDSIYNCRSGVPFQTVIIDNASSSIIGKQLKAIEDFYPDLHIIYHPTNAGFAGGNNIGITRFPSDYYVLLNNDTIVTDHWLDKLIAFLEAHPEVGLAGPTTNYAGSEQRIHVGSSNEADIITEGLKWARMCAGDYFYTSMLSFFCIAIKHEVIARVGLLDEAFGVGMFEDTDYCLRAVRNNYKIACLEDVFVFHKGSKSFNQLPDLNSLFYRNMNRYEKKHQVIWEPEHDKYLELMLHYIRSSETDQEHRAKMQYKLANKVLMLRQLNSGQLFRNYAQLFMNASGPGSGAAGMLEQIVRNPVFRYAFKTMVTLKDHGLRELIRRTASTVKRDSKVLKSTLADSFVGRRTAKTKFFRAFIIVRRHGWRELLRKIKRRLVPPASSPYSRMQLLKDIEIIVIDARYPDEAPMVPFSVVTTVKNESDNIIAFLESIESQSLRPQEVVVVDGGSTDNTAELLESYRDRSILPVKLIRGEHLNIAQGRNEGVRNARHDAIVFADAGCRLDPDFCRNLIGPLAEDQAVDLVGGVYHPIRYHIASQELIPDWNTQNSTWWKSFLPSARSQAVRKSIFLACGGFPEYLTLTGEDTLFDINYRRFSRKWVYNKKAFVYWNAPTSTEQALKLWRSYGKGNGESGIGDFDFYPHLVEFRNTGQAADATAMDAFVTGYLAGRENRSRIEISGRKIQGVVLVLADTAFAGMQPNDRLFLKCRDFIADNYKVIYVCTDRNGRERRYFDIDYSLLELYYADHFDADEFVDRYREIFHAVRVVAETDDRVLLSIERKIAALQKGGYHKLNSDSGIIGCIFQDGPKARNDQDRTGQEKDVIEHYKKWFPFEKRQGLFFANLILEKTPGWLDRDISDNKLSILDFGCSCGHLVKLLSSKYPESRVCGIDIEAVRIHKAFEYYPSNNFICGDIGNLSERFDCIFTSNVLEHFEKPFDVVSDLLLDHLNKYLVILVPYLEMNRTEGHLYTFAEQSFPPGFRGLNLQYTTVIQCNNDLWPGSQILAIYRKVNAGTN